MTFVTSSTLKSVNGNATQKTTLGTSQSPLCIKESTKENAPRKTAPKSPLSTTKSIESVTENAPRKPSLQTLMPSTSSNAPPKSQPAAKKGKELTEEKPATRIRLATPRDDGDYALDDWVPVWMGFGDLDKHLNPEASEVDRVCKFMLDKKFPIRFLNVVYSDKSRSVIDSKIEEIKTRCPKFKTFSFTNYPGGDEEILSGSWKSFVREASILKPEWLYKEFLTQKRVSISIFYCEKVYPSQWGRLTKKFHKK